jgi:hypothetical protein
LSETADVYLSAAALQRASRVGAGCVGCALAAQARSVSETKSSIRRTAVLINASFKSDKSEFDSLVHAHERVRSPFTSENRT